MTAFRITSATILTINAGMDILRGDVVVDPVGRIVFIGDSSTDFSHVPAIPFHGDFLLPGFVQAHIHLCQTLFRHHAENRHLLQWLGDRIWPMEGAHDPATLTVSAEAGIAELLRSGTTCLLDMGTVHHQDAVFDTLDRSGIRAAAGKAMMDAGDGVPASLTESTASSIDESTRLASRWHGALDDRIRYAFAPRFVLSCSPDLQREVGRLSAEHGWLIHTHSSEQLQEIEVVERLHGQRNIHVLNELGMCGPRSVFAHGVHLDASERQTLRHTCTAICHCPSSNLKLGSGIADIPQLLRDGVRVALGADGAPCNNGLDQFVEMRLAGLLQSMRLHPGALAPADILRMATIGGATALGWDADIGSIEVGKRADFFRLRRNDHRLGVVADHDPYTAIVYTGCRDMVSDVWVNGRHLVQDGQVTTLDEAALTHRSTHALKQVMARAGLSA
jgi:cytosine/adenosine deaminase-related metal-dependent hydrolase